MNLSLNFTAPPSFPMETVMNCTDVVKEALPKVKTVLLELIAIGIIFDLWQLFTHRDRNVLETMGSYVSLFIYGVLLSIILTFP